MFHHHDQPQQSVGCKFLFEAEDHGIKAYKTCIFDVLYRLGNDNSGNPV